MLKGENIAFCGNYALNILRDTATGLVNVESRVNSHLAVIMQ